RGRRRNAPGDPQQARQHFPCVLSLEAPQLVRLSRQVRRRGEKLFADQRVIAGGDEEGQLRCFGGAGDLNRADRVPRFGQNQRLGEKRSGIEAGGRFLAHHVPRQIGDVRELFFGDAVNAVFVVCFV